jgi:hypothetical protein
MAPISKLPHPIKYSLLHIPACRVQKGRVEYYEAIPHVMTSLGGSQQKQVPSPWILFSLVLYICLSLRANAYIHTIKDIQVTQLMGGKRRKYSQCHLGTPYSSPGSPQAPFWLTYSTFTLLSRNIHNSLTSAEKLCPRPTCFSCLGVKFATVCFPHLLIHTFCIPLGYVYEDSHLCGHQDLPSTCGFEVNSSKTKSSIPFFLQ